MTAELFDAVIESSKAGLRKPDPRVYRLAEDRLSVPREAIAFASAILNDAPRARTRLETEAGRLRARFDFRSANLPQRQTDRLGYYG